MIPGLLGQPAMLTPDAAPPVDPRLPRGFRNNNPLNLEASSFTQRQPGFLGSDGRFGQFGSMAEGMAAADALLAGYGRRGIDTVAGVINRWAPASDKNPVKNYAGFVAQRAGLDPNAKIDLSDPAIRARILPAMAEFENGRPLPAGGAGATPQPTMNPDNKGGDMATGIPGLLAAAMPQQQQQGGIGGLLDNPLINIGAGILAHSGPSLTPTSLGQAIGQGVAFAGKRDSERVKNEVARGNLVQQQQQRQAMTRLRERLPGLLGDAATPEQKEAIGLLAEAAPQQVGQALVNNLLGNRAAPSDVRTMQALGIPLTAEGFATYSKMKQGNNELMQAIQLRQHQFNLDKAGEDIARQRRERETAERTEREQKVRDRQTVTTTVGQVQEMAERLSVIDQSLLTRPGIGLNQVRDAALTGLSATDLGLMFGISREEASRLQTNAQRFDQLARKEAIKGIDLLKGTGAISDQKFSAATATIIDANSSPDAIRLALADIQEGMLNYAEMKGIEVKDRDKAVALIRQLRSTPEAGTQRGETQMRMPSQQDIEAEMRRRGLMQ